jgi:hypothetical protein
LIAALEGARNKEETKAAVVAALGLLVGKPSILLHDRVVVDADVGIRIEAIDFLLDLL